MEVKYCKKIKEKALFALKNYSKGHTIFVLTGKLLNNPTKYSIHIGDNLHILDDFGIYMNHSFDPSTEIKKYDVVALKDIKIGDEINFNYNDSEINMASPFICNNTLVSGKSN